ncbi:WXG100 family type VII secretion target [Actinacidiphila glaucinigra]|uniref:WXG100 family type VII secretion target n=1 Tax=Actinacidiphila glaucinigra TaxID=235986 RepID=UPI0035E37AA6
MSQLDITSANWSAGAGIVNSFHGLIESVRSVHDGDVAATAAEIGIGVVSSVLDVIAVGLDPLSKLTAVGLGWLIEHLAFLRKPLDLLAGYPQAVAKIAESLHTYAQDLRNAGEGMLSSAHTHTADWQGPASDGFRDSITAHAQRMHAVGQAVDTTGYVVRTTMALVTAVRDLIRDMITSVLGDIVATMLVALAAAAWTFGASLIVGVSRCVALAVTEVTRMMTKIGQLVGLSTRSAQRLDSLAEVLGGLAADARVTGGVRRAAAPRHTDATAGHELDVILAPAPAPAPRSVASGSKWHDDGQGFDVFRGWLNADRQLNPPPARETASTEEHGATREPRKNDNPVREPTEPSVHELPASSEHESADSGLPTASPAPAVRAAKDSLLKRFDVATLKMHEHWLNSPRFNGAFNRVKFIDSWTKSHFPAAYPYIKTLSDAKSSKNYIGLADKFALTLGKSLTDIQQQAEQAWAASNQQT